MKILLIHNNYGIYSGEEAVVDKQIALFIKMEHIVEVYRKTTEGVRDTISGSIKAFFGGFYSSSAIKDIKKTINQNKPDVVIIHNLYPFISPAILSSIRQAGIPIIMTVHNFRLICPTGLFMRNLQPCELCLQERKEWSCVKYNCENSFVKSIGYAARNWYARMKRYYKDNVDFFACITEFQIQKLTEAGFDENKMIHIPNFLDNIPEYSFTEGKYVAVSGRISKEKGIDLALDLAVRTPHIKYVFAGNIRKEYPFSVPVPDNCTFLGHLSEERMKDFYQNSLFLLNVSRCYEGFPMTILEAAAHGKPTVAPAHAGFLEIIDDNKTGLLFKPGDLDDLEKKINFFWNLKDINRFGENAYQKLKKNYSTEKIEKLWTNLLKNVNIFQKNL